MPYLKVKPDTYKLDKNQLFSFPKCQWCGSEDYTLTRYLGNTKYTGSLAHLDDIEYVDWKRSCSDCGKTTAIIPRKNKRGKR